MTAEKPSVSAVQTAMSDVEERNQQPIVIWCADGPLAEPLMQALQQGYRVNHLNDLPEPVEIQTGSAAPRVLLFCQSPVAVLVEAMQAGQLPSEALAGWMDRARALLTLNRRNRRRVNLIDIVHARRHFSAFLRHFNLSTPAEKPEPVKQDMVLELMAQQVLAGNELARGLVAELDAVTLDFDVAPEAADPDFAFQTYRNTCLARTQAETRLRQSEVLEEKFRQEVQMLREHAGLMLGELEGRDTALTQTQADLQAETQAHGVTRTELEELGKTLSETRAALGQRAAEYDEAKARLRQLEALEEKSRQEAQMLREHAGLMLGELEGRDAALAQTQADLQAETQAHGVTRAELEELGKTLSETRAALGQRTVEYDEAKVRLRQLEALAEQSRQEAQLLREHAGLMQGELEGRDAALAQAQADLQARTREWEAAKTALEQSEQNSEALSQRLAQAGREVDMLRKEIELLQAQNRTAQGAAEKLSSDKRQLEDQLAGARQTSLRSEDEAQLLRDHIQLLQQMINDMETNSASLEARLQQLRQGVESQQAQISALESEGRSLRRRAGGKERALTAAAGTLRELESRIEALNGLLSEVRADRARSQRLAAGLQDQLRRFETSRSYRMTAPLRRLRALIGRKG